MKQIQSDAEKIFYETPEDKLTRFGADMLSNDELLAILIGNERRSDRLQLSNKLLKHFDGLDGIFNATLEEVKALGIKKVKASQILAISELNRRINSLRASKKEIKITCPADFADMVMNEMKDLEQEILKVVFLNTKNIVIGSKDVFKGSLNNSIVHPREIFKPAINKSSASIIICHNHPSGDPTPSTEDINITLRIKECGSILGIKLLDHIIIGNNKFISLKDRRFV